jgi:hypothetical protein
MLHHPLPEPPRVLQVSRRPALCWHGGKRPQYRAACRFHRQYARQGRFRSHLARPNFDVTPRAYPFMASDNKALAGYGLSIAYSFYETVAHDCVRMLACDARKGLGVMDSQDVARSLHSQPRSLPTIVSVMVREAVLTLSSCFWGDVVAACSALIAPEARAPCLHELKRGWSVLQRS